MKKLLLLTVLSGLFLFGCSDVGTNNITEPVTSPSAGSKQIVKLPERQNVSTEWSWSTWKRFNNKETDKIVLTDQYTSLSGKTVTVTAVLTVPAGAFDADHEDITMTADDGTATLTFTPHMVFNKPLTLDVTYSGLDLRTMIKMLPHLGFYYIDDNGSITPIANQGIRYNIFTGTISVKGAQIEHFSRYGFIT